MNDPVSACRVAIQAVQQEAIDASHEGLVRGGLGTEGLLVLSGRIQGIQIACERFDAALKEALRNDPDREEDE